MKRIKPSLVLAAAAVVGMALWAGAYVEQTGSRMAVAADRFLDSLSKDQAEKAVFDFDSPERINWHFIPRERQGHPDQGADARAARPGLRPDLHRRRGRRLPQGHDDHEPRAGPPGDREGLGPGPRPRAVFPDVFGTPSDRGKWGWRVEGHHLSLNFVLEDGKVVAATPSFFGANPAEVRQGPRQGLRTLADREDTALRLLQALDGNQKKVAVVSAEAPKEIRAAGTPQPPTDAAPGIGYAELNGDQKALLRALIESYSSDMPDEVAKAWLDEIRRAGPEGIKFSWTGPGRSHPAPRLPRPGPDLPDRVQQHPEQRQPHPLRLAEHARRLRRPAGVEVNSFWHLESGIWNLASGICEFDIWNPPMPSPPAPIPELPPQALRQRLDAGEALTLLDVREPRERAFCAIAVPATAGDLHIPMREIPARLDDIQAALARGPLVDLLPSRRPLDGRGGVARRRGSRERSSICAGASTPGRPRSIPRSGATDHAHIEVEPRWPERITHKASQSPGGVGAAG